MIESVGILYGQVARVQPTIFINDLVGGLLVLIVATHYVVAAAAYLARLINAALFASLWVEYLHLYAWVLGAHRCGALLHSVLGAGCRHAWRRLCKTVD